MRYTILRIGLYQPWSTATSEFRAPTGTSRLVDRLEGAGLVERAEAEDDKRGAYAVLTKSGRKHFQETARQHTDLVREQFLSHLSHKDMKTLAAVWERLDEARSAP